MWSEYATRQVICGVAVRGHTGMTSRTTLWRCAMTDNGPKEESRRSVCECVDDMDRLSIIRSDSGADARTRGQMKNRSALAESIDVKCSKLDPR